MSTANEIREGVSSFEPNDYGKRDIGELKDLHFYPFDDSEKVLKTIVNIAKGYKKSKKRAYLKFQV